MHTVIDNREAVKACVDVDSYEISLAAVYELV